MSKVTVSVEFRTYQIVEASRVLVDGKPLIAGDRAPEGFEFTYFEQPGGWYKQYVQRKIAQGAAPHPHPESTSAR